MIRRLPRLTPRVAGPVLALCCAAAFAAAPGSGAAPQPVQETPWIDSDTFASVLLPSIERHSDVLLAGTSLPAVPVAGVDRAAVALEDEIREANGLAPRFAIPNAVNMNPAANGLWERAGGERVWRLRISSPGAYSLNLGFSAFRMPEGGRLFIYSTDMTKRIRPFTAEDNALHGELWTPPILSDDIVVEVTLPEIAASKLLLDLASINVGYRGFNSEPTRPESGACNVDIVCPQGDLWRKEIQSVAVISTGGSTFCTGFMVNNTAQDQKPYFMTANHCGITAGNAPSLVAFWNFETTPCGGSPNGSMADFQSGSFFRSSRSPSDFTLVELDSPPDPKWDVTFSGWNNSGADASSAVGIHHPNTDEKRISFENDPTETTSYLGTTVPGDGTHVRIVDWDLGTTEPGSSGSPLFNQNHQIIGQLHGGFASCSSQTSDYYGKFSVSWVGGGTNATRLSNWLDPLSTGAASISTLLPASGDCNGNGNPDHQEIITGAAGDCNANREPDSCDLANGVLHDVNANGIPDECEGVIPCADINGFQARCNAGTIQARIRLTSTSHNGQSVSFGVDANPNAVTISGDKATLQIPGQGGTGSHTVSLLTPSGCVSPIVVTCP